MDIEFDPAKDQTNTAKHSVSLIAAARFDWNTALEREDYRFDYGEIRFVALGFIDGRLHVLVFTEGSHDDAIRAISLRRAEIHEARYSMRTKFDPSIHDDNPPLTDEFAAGMKPSRRGRPSTGSAREQISVRLDQDVVAKLREAGMGWQSQINTLLREALKLDGHRSP